ncbi:hypothetical protein VTH06DRAFT_7376 [Thermothelomyces fergusii]
MVPSGVRSDGQMMSISKPGVASGLCCLTVKPMPRWFQVSLTQRSLKGRKVRFQRSVGVSPPWNSWFVMSSTRSSGTSTCAVDTCARSMGPCGKKRHASMRGREYRVISSG